MDESADAIAVDLILELVERRYGYEFGQYRRETLQRVIASYAEDRGCEAIAELIPPLLRGREQFEPFLQALTINTTELFRDPEFFAAFRAQVIPSLQTFPRVGLWLAGCASGEEVWSVAVLLKESGLLDRTQLYATDINRQVLKQAQAAEYEAVQVEEAHPRYLQSGGAAMLEDYFEAHAGRLRVQEELRKVAMISRHNLASDDVFAQVQVVLCRNVLIYFSTELKRRVLDCFCRSLTPGGYLCLGAQEANVGLASDAGFELVDAQTNIFRKRLS